MLNYETLLIFVYSLILCGGKVLLIVVLEVHYNVFYLEKNKG